MGARTGTPEGPAPVRQAPPGGAEGNLRSRRADVVALTILLAAAGTLRFVGLSSPPELVFDETYYARDACLYVMAAAEPCGLETPQIEAHPPLGKWLIGIGIAAFGFDSFGWRFVPAVAGTITVALLYLLARRLFEPILGAILAAGLLALDLLHLAQSRIAMLDIFVPLFGLAAVLFSLYDRDHVAIGTPLSRMRPWRIAAGASAGAAVASKWSGIFFVILVIVLTASWAFAARRAGGWARGAVRAVKEEAPTIVAWLIVLPAIVYVLSYAGRVEGSVLALPWSDGSFLGTVGSHQIEMYDIHTEGVASATHHYQSPAWTWILIKRPVSYYFATPDGQNEEILALGNPFVWWASILAVAYVASVWARRTYARLRDKALGRPGPEGVILAGVVLTYGPWLVQPTERSAVFLFYLLPTVPFMCLALGYVATRIGNSMRGRAAIGLFAAITIGLFAYFYPLVGKRPLSPEQWRDRMWFDDCDSGPPKTRVVTATETGAGGKTILRTSTEAVEGQRPPEGWCWI
jgi:dolichyl-phosphate-mannose-protein mannosyltransferase